MSISNGDFTDESGNAVNLMALLRDGSVVESNADHHMAPHSGWFTDEEGEPVNIITLIQNGSGGGGSVTVDSQLSSTSINPVQNRIIFTALEGKAGTSIATPSANGLLSAADKTTLDELAADYHSALVAMGVIES
jgi:hypothetical protein